MCHMYVCLAKWWHWGVVGAAVLCTVLLAELATHFAAEHFFHTSCYALNKTKMSKKLFKREWASLLELRSQNVNVALSRASHAEKANS